MGCFYSNSIKEIKSYNKIYENMICRIKPNKRIGFLCNLLVPNKKEILTILITTYLNLGEKMIKQNQKIELEYKNKNIEIILDSSRKIYTDAKYDITIIEIQSRDTIELINLLKIKNNISENYLNYKKIQLVH